MTPARMALVACTTMALAACKPRGLDAAPTAPDAGGAAPTAVAPAPAGSHAARPRQVPLPSDAVRIATVAGALEIVTVQPLLTYEVRLAGRTIARTDMNNPNDARINAPMPSVAAMFDGVAPYDQVLVLRWDGPGNACDGYGYTFLGLNHDGGFAFSPDVEYCGGPAPEIRVEGAGIRLTVAAHPPNHGTGILPAESWLFEHGELRKK